MVISTIFVFLLSVIQCFFIFNFRSGDSDWYHLKLHNVIRIIKKFFGFYTIFIDSSLSTIVGLLILIVIFSAVFFVKNKENYLLLLFCLFATIALPCARVYMSGIHPITGGPRYFFFPYIILSWTLIYLVVQGGKMALPAGGILALALAGLPPRALSHQQAITPWPIQVQNCLSHDVTIFQIQFDGNAQSVWSKQYTKKNCEDGMKQAIFK